MKDTNATNSNIPNSPIDGDNMIAVKHALNLTVRSNTKPVALTVGSMYLIFSVAHYFLLPNDIKLFMTSLAFISAIIFFAIAFVS